LTTAVPLVVVEPGTTGIGTPCRATAFVRFTHQSGALVTEGSKPKCSPPSQISTARSRKSFRTRPGGSVPTQGQIWPTFHAVTYSVISPIVTQPSTGNTSAG